jgi:hypothetical protein
MSDPMLPILKQVAQNPGLLKEIYGDLAKPGVSQVGKALSTVLGLGNTILWPLALLNERAKLALEKNLERYRQQLEEVPAEEISEVPPEVGVGVAEKLAYVTNEQLSELYINLLAKASTTRTANLAHPSFVNIVNNLSPDEAMLLQKFRGTVSMPFLEARLVDSEGPWKVLGEVLTGLERTTELLYPANIVAYLSNFEGLGIVNIRHDICMVRPDPYPELESIYKQRFEQYSSHKENETIEFERGKIEVTRFGLLFMSACLTKLNPT